MGLNICKLICRNLGGDIKVVSQVGEGATFTFWVSVETEKDCDIDFTNEEGLQQPSGRELAAVQATKPVLTKTALKMKMMMGAPLEQENKKLTIICADDIYYNLEALRLVFNNLGLIDHCIFVSDGQQAFDSYVQTDKESRGKCDLVCILILDFEMPMMTGLDVKKEIVSYIYTQKQIEMQQTQHKMEPASKMITRKSTGK